MTLSNAELNLLGIRQWSDLKTKHKELDLLLGNGFSINFSDKFRYGSIYERFKENCAPIYKTLFFHFDTTNFEEIMLMLTYAKRVNNIFNLSISEVTAAIEELKNGLIASINEVHPRSSELSSKLINALAHQFVTEFKDVFSLSYDLMLYKIIMAAYNAWEVDNDLVFLQDYCWGKRDVGTHFREFMDYQSRGDDHNSVYYIHGNLALFNNKFHVLKLIRDDKDPNEVGVELIELIARRIHKGNFPLFVSEGTMDEKKQRISSNKYLTFCFNKLGAAKRPLMIFGLTLAPNDMHIVNQIINRPRPIIISVYPEGRSEIDLNKELADHRFKFGNNFRQPIDFVDSRSVFPFL
jgi:hypothetical protein